MIDELAGLFHGDLAEVGAVLVLKDDPRSFEPVSAMMQPDRLSAILENFSTIYPNPEPRAVASQWSKIYFSKLIVPSVAASLILDWQLPLNIDETEVLLDNLGRAEAFRLTGPGSTSNSQTAEDRFSFLIDVHLEPLIGAIKKVSGLSRNVLWSNAGNIIENVIEYCAKVAPDIGGIVEARALLAARQKADGTANPLFEPVRYTELAALRTRKRRVCCIRYLIPSLDYCETCPLSKCHLPLSPTPVGD